MKNYKYLTAFSGICLQFILLMSLFNGWVRSLSYDTYHHPRSADFYSIYEAGHQVLLFKNIYNPEPDFRRVPLNSGYRYLPPAAFILGVPLNIIPPLPAYLLWILVQIGLMIINIGLTFKLIGKSKDNTDKFMAVFLWTFFFPFNVEYHMGQFSFLMSSLLFWTYIALKNSRFTLSSVWWTLSIMLKSFSILFVPIYLKEKKYKLTAVVLFIVLLGALPYYLIFPEGWSRFRMLNLSVTLGMGGILYKGNLGAQMFLQYLLHPVFSNESFISIGQWNWTQLTFMVTLFSAVAVIAALLTTMIKPSDIKITFPLWICVFFLIFRDVWENQYVMFLPALVIIFYEKIFSPKFFFPLFFIIALPSVHFWIKDIPEIDFTTLQNFLYYGPKPFAVFIVYLGLLYKGMIKK